ncbi:MAG: hypothetical protein ACTMKV_12810, partial [Sphingomonas parapaucimobilis]
MIHGSGFGRAGRRETELVDHANNRARSTTPNGLADRLFGCAEAKLLKRLAIDDDVAAIFPLGPVARIVATMRIVKDPPGKLSTAASSRLSRPFSSSSTFSLR